MRADEAPYSKVKYYLGRINTFWKDFFSATLIHVDTRFFLWVRALITRNQARQDAMTKHSAMA